MLQKVFRPGISMFKPLHSPERKRFSSPTKSEKFGARKRVLLDIQVFWDITLCRWVQSYRRLYGL